MSAYLCKGCGSAIIPGQLRRGDNWHAECYSQAEVRVFGKALKTYGKQPKGLTRTQHIILDEAACSPTGSVVFARGDRKGTRIARVDELDRPVIVAYSSPEYFLVQRGLLEAANERHVYRITAAGRVAVRGARD